MSYILVKMGVNLTEGDNMYLDVVLIFLKSVIYL
jgi:hypothetical protein